MWARTIELSQASGQSLLFGLGLNLINRTTPLWWVAAIYLFIIYQIKTAFHFSVYLYLGGGEWSALCAHTHTHDKNPFGAEWGVCAVVPRPFSVPFRSIQLGYAPRAPPTSPLCVAVMMVVMIPQQQQQQITNNKQSNCTQPHTPPHSLSPPGGLCVCVSVQLDVHLFYHFGNWSEI